MVKIVVLRAMIAGKQGAYLILMGPCYCQPHYGIGSFAQLHRPEFFVPWGAPDAREDCQWLSRNEPKVDAISEPRLNGARQCAWAVSE